MYEFLPIEQAITITGHGTTGAFRSWRRRYNADNPGHPILRRGHAYDRYSIERAILRQNGVEAQ